MEWDYRYTVFVLALAGQFSLLGARLVISPVVPTILDAFEVSKAAIGLALTVMWAMSALFQYPSGVLSARFGERRVLLTAIGLTALASLVIAMAPTFLLFGLFVAILGMAAGLYFPSAASLLTRLFPNTGRVLGFLVAGGSIAGLVGPVAATYVAGLFDWRAALLLGTGVAVPVFVLFGWLVRPTPTPDSTETIRANLNVDTVVGTLSRPEVAFTITVAVLSVFVFQAFASFFPTFLQEYRAFTPEQAGLAFGLVFLLSTVTLPIFGNLSDVVGRDLTLGSTFLLTAAGFTLLLVGKTRIVVIVGILTIGVGISWAGVVSARFMDIFTDEQRNAGFGLVRTVYTFVGAFGSVVVGTLVDLSGWLLAYGTLVVLLVAATSLLVFNSVLGLEL